MEIKLNYDHIYLYEPTKHGHRGGERGFYPYLSFDIFIAIGRFSAG